MGNHERSCSIILRTTPRAAARIRADADVFSRIRARRCATSPSRACSRCSSCRCCGAIAAVVACSRWSSGRRGRGAVRRFFEGTRGRATGSSSTAVTGCSGVSASCSSSRCCCRAIADHRHARHRARRDAGRSSRSSRASYPALEKRTRRHRRRQRGERRARRSCIFALLWIVTLPLWLTGIGAVVLPALNFGVSQPAAVPLRRAGGAREPRGIPRDRSPRKRRGSIVLGLCSARCSTTCRSSTSSRR